MNLPPEILKELLITIEKKCKALGLNYGIKSEDNICSVIFFHDGNPNIFLTDPIKANQKLNELLIDQKFHNRQPVPHPNAEYC